jgi:hypothetical protein
MNLATRSLITTELTAPEVMEPIEYGWPAVRSGLHSILLGYLVVVGMGVFAALLVVGVVYTVSQAQGLPDFVDAALLIYAGIGILFLMGLGSFTLIVKGSIRCLINAPERCGARWLMFVSTLCVVIGPALNFVSGLVGPKVKPVMVARTTGAADEVNQILREYGKSLQVRDGRAYVALAGNVTNLLSGIFFVLFLRAVARCFDDVARMRVAEAYLLFSGLLTAASVYFFLNPLELLANPQFILLLVGAWVLSGLWYFMLLLSTSACIFEGLERRRPALEI